MKTQNYIRRSTSLLALCIAFTIVGRIPALAGPLIYSTADFGALLVTIDFATGETKVIGPTGQIQAEGLALDRAGTLYTMTHAFDTTGESQLAKINLTTGEAVPYGVKNGLQFMGLPSRRMAPSTPWGIQRAHFTRSTWRQGLPPRLVTWVTRTA